MRALVERLFPTVEARVMQTLLRHKRRAVAEQVSDDLTQQVFVRLFEDGGRRLRAWEPDRGAALRTFVALLAEREVIAILRRGRKNPWTESPTPADELTARAGSAGDHEARFASRELLDAVLDRALARLDERGLLLFQRLVVDEAAVDQVAGETGASAASLYMWKSRFAKLAREIADEMAGDGDRGGAERAFTSRSIALQPAWKAR
jgi:RNA polymerase sigma factor (sigma-70 family)